MAVQREDRKLRHLNVRFRQYGLAGSRPQRRSGNRPSMRLALTRPLRLAEFRWTSNTSSVPECAGRIGSYPIALLPRPEYRTSACAQVRPEI